MTLPIADDTSAIADALKALRDEIPPWRKPVEPDPTPEASCAKCGGLGYVWAASHILGRIDCLDCTKPTGISI